MRLRSLDHRQSFAAEAVVRRTAWTCSAVLALLACAASPSFARTAGQPICGWNTLVPEIDPTGGAAPLGRVVHSAIVDAPRNRLVIYGGDALVGDSIHTQGDVWALGLDGNPAWTQLLPAGAGSGNRRQHTAIFDAPRDRMIVFGGIAYTDARVRYWPDDSASVWSLSLSGAPAWTLLPTRGASMTRRYAHAAVYDPVRQRMWVYGGADQFATFSLSSRLDYVFLGDPDVWTAVTPPQPAPPALAEHVMVYDSARDRILLWGGIGPTGAANGDLWELGLSPVPAWTKLVTTGTPPPTTVNIRAVYDPVGDQVIVDGPEATYALTLANGPQWRPARPHALRYTPAVAYDSAGVRVLAMGGEDLEADFNSVLEMTPPPTVRWSAVPPEAGAVQVTYHGDCPETATLTVFPNHGWDFSGWSGDATGSDSVLALALGGGKNVVANFSVSTATVVTQFEAIRTVAGVELRFGFGDASRVVLRGIDRRLVGGTAWQPLDLEIRHEYGSEVAIDAAADPGSEYEYRLRIALDTGEEFVVGPVRSAASAAAALTAIESVFPNPSFGRTAVTFVLARDGPVRLVVLDVAGREVAELVSGHQARGRYQVAWDTTAHGHALPAGLYFARLTAQGRSSVIRMAISR